MADQSHIEELEQQAALYALGALPEEDAQKFAHRLTAGCPVCCAEVRGCQQAMAALAMSVPQVEPPAEARSRLLEALGNKKESASGMGEGIIVRKTETSFEASPIPGVQIRNLLGKKTMLVRMAPKSYLPEHNHKAAEQCLVLEGSITSEGVTAYAGDYTYMPAGSAHHPLYSETGCLLLIAYT
jgi:quercetin dioxygenase-like cupin family protein